MANCQRCGLKLGFFESPPRCDDCNANLVESVYAFHQHFEKLFADRVFTRANEDELRVYQRQLNLADTDIPTIIPRIQRAKMLTANGSGLLPTLPLDGVALAPGEVGHFSAAADHYREAVSQAFVGGAPLAGSSGGWWAPRASMISVARGHLMITSRHVRFVTHTSNEVALPTILGVTWYANAIELACEGSLAKDFFVVDDGELAASILSGAQRNLQVTVGPYR